MTREDIIRMAREVGITLPLGPFPERGSFALPDLLAIVRRAYESGAAAERQRCAQIARQWDETHPNTNYGGYIARLIEETAP